MNKRESAPSWIDVFQYSFLALPLAFAGLPLYVHAPDFYTRDLGVDIGMIGIVLLAVRLIDGVQDPLIGYYSDRYANRRFSIVIAGTFMLVSGMVAVFYGPQSSISPLIWFAMSIVLATTGFSILTINQNMIGGLWHKDPQQRTRISAWREAFGLVGLLVASVLPVVLQEGHESETAFKMLSLIFAVIMICGFLLFSRFMKTLYMAPPHPLTKACTTKGFSFLKILAGPDRGFFVVCFLTHLAASFPGVLVLFFINDYLGAEEFTGLFLSLYFVSGAMLMPVWVKLANKVGKEIAWLMSMLLAVTTFIWAFFIEPYSLMSYGTICILSGLALGADLSLPPSIIADRITAQKTESEATQYYALLAFIPKIAIAIASFVAFTTLDQLDFVAGQVNTYTTMSGLAALYALVPCVIKLGAAGLLWHLQKKEGERNA